MSADDNTSTTTPSTIGSIGADDTVSVDQPQGPAPTCLDLGGGVGQMSDTFAPCELPTTTLVEVGTPPTTTPAQLPATGVGISIGLLVALTVIGVGVVVRMGTRWTR